MGSRLGGGVEINQVVLPHTILTAELTDVSKSSQRLEKKEKKLWKKSPPKLLNTEILLPVKKYLSNKSVETRTINVGNMAMCLPHS